MANKNQTSEEMTTILEGDNIITSVIEFPNAKSQLELYNKIEELKREINKSEQRRQSLQTIYDEWDRFLKIKANLNNYIKILNE